MSDRPAPERDLVAGQYQVDVTRRLADAGGGLPAYTAINRRAPGTRLMALAVERLAPARPEALRNLASGLDGLLTPLAHGAGPPIDGKPAAYVICQAPPGPPLSANPRPWSELNLIELVLRPIAAVLEQLQERGLTHRAIRLNNVFQANASRPVVLGAAWAAPPAMHQPAVYEPVASAVCLPAARGDGAIADDVYALGVLLIALALGRQPLAGLDDRAVMLRKVEFGDFMGVAGQERLPPVLGDLARGMLAEDPEHRPSPALLRDTVGTRGRRVAARPPPKALRALKLGGMTIWNNRTLALAMVLEPDESLTAIQNGTLMYWLRRGLGDSNLAVKLEELVRQQAQDMGTERDIAQALLLMRAILDVDMMMPLCWRGVAVWPDGLGPLLIAVLDGPPEQRRKLVDIVNSEAQAIWALLREERAPSTPSRLEARQRRAILQSRGPAGGLPRLAYALNPLASCLSPLLQAHWITTVAELAPVLDELARTSPDADLLEPLIAAFIGARSERWLDQEVQALSGAADDAARAEATLRLLAEIQQRYHLAPLRGLTAWVAARARPLVERWKNRERRADVETRLNGLVADGFLQPIARLLRDRAAHATDTEGLTQARAELRLIDAALSRISDGGPGRGALAARLGQEIAAGIGLAALAVTLLLRAFG